jgi:hypothetical protein
MVLRGRAITPEQKREVMGRILTAWLRAPDLRLGQLIVNTQRPPGPGPDLFNVEDFELANDVRRFAKFYDRLKRMSEGR